MSKKIKLDLKHLKVRSFVTSLSTDEKSKIRGADMARTVDPWECMINYTEYCTENCQNSYIDTCCPICVV
jgi:hypothetical protein